MIPIVDYILGYFSEELCIDLGTANTLVYVRGKGIVIREPSIVAQHRRTKKVLAIGREAKMMIGKTPQAIEAVRPLKDGVVCDFDSTLAMLSYFVRKVHEKPGKRFLLPRPKVVIGVPMQISEVEKRAVVDAAHASGVRQVFLVEEPAASALGAGLPVGEAVGSMIVDIGGGTCEIAVLALGGIVVGSSLRVSGDAMDLAIISYIRSRWGLLIGERTAEEVKMLIGSAYPMVLEKETVVRGRDLESGLPRSIKINSTQIREALAPVINTILGAVKEIIEDTPPELISDVAERGIMLSGGGGLLAGLAKLISQETKMPVTVAEDPLAGVVIGCAKLLEDEMLLRKLAIAKSSR